MVNPIVETFIGLVFVYLLLSMVCSALQEFVAAVLALRAKTLSQGLSNVLCGDENLVAEIYAHPLIKGLSRKSWWDKLLGREARPSYISAELFAKAFVAAAGVNGSAPGTVPQLAANQKPLEASTRKLFETFASYSPGDINTLRANIEDWYNDAMDRVSGWYKRKAQLVILIIALIVALSTNADTFMLSRAFWHDPTLRAAAVTAASDWVKTHQAQPAQTSQQNLAEMFPSTTEPGTAPLPPREETLKQATGNLVNTLGEVQTQLNLINVPLGWFCNCEDKQVPTQGADSAGHDGTRGGGDATKPGKSTKALKEDDQSAKDKIRPASVPCIPGQIPSDWQGWTIKIFGLVVTMLAISQGAPFWFDLLQKLVNLRLAGDAPDEKKKGKRSN